MVDSRTDRIRVWRFRDRLAAEPGEGPNVIHAPLNLGHIEGTGNGRDLGLSL